MNTRVNRDEDEILVPTAYRDIAGDAEKRLQNAAAMQIVHEGTSQASVVSQESASNLVVMEEPTVNMELGPASDVPRDVAAEAEMDDSMNVEGDLVQDQSTAATSAEKVVDIASGPASALFQETTTHEELADSMDVEEESVPKQSNAASSSQVPPTNDAEKEQPMSIDAAEGNNTGGDAATALAVEKVLRKRTNSGGKVEYCIQWNNGHKTWETRFNMAAYIGAIEAYDASLEEPTIGGRYMSIDRVGETGDDDSRTDGESSDEEVGLLKRSKRLSAAAAAHAINQSKGAEDYAQEDQSSDEYDGTESSENENGESDLRRSSRRSLGLSQEDATIPSRSFGPHMVRCDKCGRTESKRRDEHNDLEGELGPLISCASCAVVWHQPCVTTKRKILSNGLLQCSHCIKEDPLCLLCKLPPHPIPPESLEDEDPPIEGVVRPLFRCFRCGLTTHIECIMQLYLEDVDDTGRTFIKSGVGSRQWFEKEWKCVDCIVWDDKVESILTYRELPPDPREEEEAEVSLRTREFYVKFASWSYRHCTWVSERWLSHLKHEQGKYKNFIKMVEADNEQAKAEGQAPVWPMEVDDVLPPDVLLVEKILDATYHNLHGTEVLDNVKEVYIKWKGLDHDKCYWEQIPPEDDPLYPDIVREYEQFLKRDAIGDLKSVPTRKKGFEEYDEQPDFIGYGQLYPYQLEGLNWLLYKWHKETPCILADEMGLGKTAQIVSLLACLHHDYHRWPSLIAVPSSMLGPWQRELRRWAPKLVVTTYTGSHEARKVIREHEIYGPKDENRKQNKNVRFHVLLANYEMLARDCAYFRNIDFEILVCDEGHRFKNDSAKTFTAFKKNLKVRHRIIMTGTPLQNNVRELFNLLFFLDPAKFSNPKELEEKYGTDELNNESVEELHEPYFLRRTKDDANVKLPPKIETLVPVSLTPLQKELYKAILARNSDILKSIGVVISGKDDARVSPLQNILMELRKICNHPYTLPDVEPKDLPEDEAHKRLIESGAKLALLHRMLPKLKARGHRVLIFSQFKLALNVLEDYMVAEGYNFFRMDGDVKSDLRQPMIDQFNAPDSDYFAFLLTTRTGGEGINLPTADTIIIYDADWNPQRDIQAIARAHRIGQTKPLAVYRLFTSNSVEEKIIQVAKKKLVLDHLIISSMSRTEVTKEEYSSIIKFGAKALFEEDKSNEQGDGANAPTEARQIKYDDKAVEDLLNLSVQRAAEAAAAHESAEPAKAGAFAFAKVWNVEKHTEEDLEDVAELPDQVQDDDEFWNNLLKEAAAGGTIDLEVDEHGRSRRKRKQVTYFEDKADKRSRLYEDLPIDGREPEEDQEPEATHEDPEFHPPAVEEDVDESDGVEDEVIISVPGATLDTVTKPTKAARVPKHPKPMATVPTKGIPVETSATIPSQQRTYGANLQAMSVRNPDVFQYSWSRPLQPIRPNLPSHSSAQLPPNFVQGHTAHLHAPQSGYGSSFSPVPSNFIQGWGPPPRGNGAHSPQMQIPSNVVQRPPSHSQSGYGTSSAQPPGRIIQEQQTHLHVLPMSGNVFQWQSARPQLSQSGYGAGFPQMRIPSNFAQRPPPQPQSSQSDYSTPPRGTPSAPAKGPPERSNIHNRQFAQPVAPPENPTEGLSSQPAHAKSVRDSQAEPQAVHSSHGTSGPMTQTSVPSGVPQPTFLHTSKDPSVPGRQTFASTASIHTDAEPHTSAEVPSIHIAHSMSTQPLTTTVPAKKPLEGISPEAEKSARTMVKIYTTPGIAPTCWLCLFEFHPIEKCPMRNNEGYLRTVFKQMVLALRFDLSGEVTEGIFVKLKLIALFFKKLGCEAPGPIPDLPLPKSREVMTTKAVTSTVPTVPTPQQTASIETIPRLHGQATATSASTLNSLPGSSAQQFTSLMPSAVPPRNGSPRTSMGWSSTSSASATGPRLQQLPAVTAVPTLQATGTSSLSHTTPVNVTPNVQSSYVQQSSRSSEESVRRATSALLPSSLTSGSTIAGWNYTPPAPTASFGGLQPVQSTIPLMSGPQKSNGLTSMVSSVGQYSVPSLGALPLQQLSIVPSTWTQLETVPGIVATNAVPTAFMTYGQRPATGYSVMEYPTQKCLFCSASDHRTEDRNCPLLQRNPTEHRRKLREFVREGRVNDLSIKQVTDLDLLASYYEKQRTRTSNRNENSSAIGTGALTLSQSSVVHPRPFSYPQGNIQTWPPSAQSAVSAPSSAGQAGARSGGPSHSVDAFIRQEQHIYALQNLWPQAQYFSYVHQLPRALPVGSSPFPVTVSSGAHGQQQSRIIQQGNVGTQPVTQPNVPSGTIIDLTEGDGLYSSKSNSNTTNNNSRPSYSGY
ncbi:hypothetical protein SpCBS45565_g04370 [Spizellomyces sp. 'palustris']|nr:hypothetical protein SpCBS45565_g04370 [Spizellomyces sp. 'palustris']